MGGVQLKLVFSCKFSVTKITMLSLNKFSQQNFTPLKQVKHISSFGSHNQKVPT